ncbi:MAG: IS982 family transposase, partial [Wolbachia endosymbiont of Tyrophagus putrescentiae]|nr:IS982 family transposase [Wolbachia endosymbiont of Tyrophagus putrescentiae]
TRHRSPINFLVHIFSVLVSYCFMKKKPKISMTCYVG